MVPLGDEAPTDGFGVSGDESSVLLIMESIAVLGLTDPKMTAFNVVKHLPNHTS
jgi:hypothetical protein